MTSEPRNLAAFLGYLASFGDVGLDEAQEIQLATAVDLLVLDIDERVALVLNSVLHAPEFQRLEASWRGIHHLVSGIARDENIVVAVWSASKAEVAGDLANADDLTRSSVFSVAYTEEYGQFGGNPYAAVFCDFEVTVSPGDLALLSALGTIGMFAHAGVFLGVPASLVGVEHWGDLRDATDVFEGPQYAAWRSFRESDESRYVGLILPRELMRAPYHAPPGSVVFVETIYANGHGLLWGSPVYSLALRFARVFARTGLLASIVGQDNDSPSVVAATRSPTLRGRQPKFSLEAAVTPRLERQLRDHGMIVWQQTGDRLVLASANSLALPKTFGSSPKGREATINHLLGTRFPYLFVALRFAHYLKVIERECIGGGSQASDVEQRLSQWLNQFVANQDGASPWIRATRPLRQVKVTVTPVAGVPGAVESRVLLRPHVRYLGSLLALSVHMPDVSRMNKLTLPTPAQGDASAGT